MHGGVGSVHEWQRVKESVFTEFWLLWGSSSIFGSFYLSLDANKQCRDRLGVRCPQDISSDPAWSGKVNIPISNKPPPGKPFTLQHLLYIIYFYNIYFSATSPLHLFPFLQRCPSSSSGCIDRSSASLWVSFYRITLGFNLQAHRWGFV
jgi:hypothetical protein